MAIVATQLLPAMSLEGIQTEHNYIFLFQRNSITDCNRIRNSDWNHSIDHGAAYLLASIGCGMIFQRKFFIFLTTASVVIK
jgi:hypothetical protein